MTTIWILVALTSNNPKPIGTYANKQDCFREAEKIYKTEKPVIDKFYCIPVDGYLVPREK